MRKISLSLLLVLVLPCHAQEDTIWLQDPAQLACSPSELGPSGTLVLKLGPGHGRELGVRRHSDNIWYFLVVGGPPDNAKVLMTPELFETRRQVDVPASLTTTEWVTGQEVPVFSGSGTYSIYVSDNLESEAGGYVCTVHYVGPHGA
jgi:hypothetical protein